MRRRARLRPVSKTKKYRRRSRRMDFMAYILFQPCVLQDASGAGKCWGRVQADHAGSRPYGQKAPDDTCIPLCTKHHRDRTDYTGYFKGWRGAQMRAWCDLRIYNYQQLYTMKIGLRQTPWRT